MYLFDTDVITNILKKRPSSHLIRHLEKLAPDEQFVTVITVAEIVYGAQKSGSPQLHLDNLEKVLLPVVAVLDFDIEAAYLAGKIRAELEKAGMRIAWADIQIAAIAMANELTLVTGNVRHFSRISGLVVENWLRPT